MPKKTFTPEQIVTKLREIEECLDAGRNHRFGGQFSRFKRTHYHHWKGAPMSNFPRHGKTRIGSVYLNLGSDGDQWIITPTKDGGIVITHVPPREPVTNQLTTLPSAVISARQISTSRISEHFGASGDIAKEVMAAVALLEAKEPG